MYQNASVARNAPETCPVQYPARRSALSRLLDRQLAEYLGSIEEPVHVLDGQGFVVWANAAAKGRKTFRLQLGVSKWKSLWPEELQLEAQASFLKALDEGTASFNVEYACERRGNACSQVSLTRTTASMQLGAIVIAVSAPKPLGLDRSGRRTSLDRLTGLPNEDWFLAELETRTRSTHGSQPIALVVFDLDHLGDFSRRAGSTARDDVKLRFGKELAGRGGETCFLGHLDTNRFALVFDLGEMPYDLTGHVARLLQQCADPIASVAVNAGVAIFPRHASNGVELMRNAEAALHAAKASGQGRCVMFDGSMRQALQRHSSMLNIARAAIARDLVRPYYQSKVNLLSGRAVGLEALLRLEGHDGTIHPPAYIVAALDDPETAPRITDLMLRKIISDAKTWAGTEAILPIAFNASGADLRDPGFAANLLEQLAVAGLPPERFELEVTEGVFLGHGAENVDVCLRKLNEAGVRIALDDFGTGYASLTHLRDYPVDVIKIDRSFVADLVGNPDDRAIVGAMINLSKSMAIAVVAEGVENRRQLSVLRELGCDTGQGFLFDHPMPGSQVPNMIARRNT